MNSAALSSGPFTAPEVPSDGPLAPRSLRLVGAIVDFLLIAICFLGPAFLGIGLAGGPDAIDQNELLKGLLGLIMLAGLLGIQATNWYFITTRGQSLAKMVLGIRIVQLDGSPCGFVRGVLLRNWILGFVTGILNYCCMGWMVQLLNALPIFGEERRCLHDHLAGTKVVLATETA